MSTPDTPGSSGRGLTPEYAVQRRYDDIGWSSWSAEFTDYEQAYRYWSQEQDRDPRTSWRLVRRQVTAWEDVHV